MDKKVRYHRPSKEKSEQSFCPQRHDQGQRAKEVRSGQKIRAQVPRHRRFLSSELAEDDIQRLHRPAENVRHETAPHSADAYRANPQPNGLASIRPTLTSSAAHTLRARPSHSPVPTHPAPTSGDNLDLLGLILITRFSQHRSCER